MDVTPRFFTLNDVAEMLSTSMDQVYALVRRGDLRGIKIGGRGQWRVEASALEEYIATVYQATEEYIAAHPYDPVSSPESELEPEPEPRT